MATTCTCEQSSDGKCSHIAALLYLIEDVSIGRQPLIEFPSTSKAQQWGKGKTVGKKPKPLHVDDYQQHRPTNSVILVDPRPQHLRHTTQEELNNFLINQQSFPHPTLWQDCKVVYEDYELSPQRRNLLLELTDTFLCNMASSTSKLSLDDLSTTTGIHVRGTEAQGACSSWKEERKFRVTASIFQDFHRNPSNCANNLLWSRQKDISTLPSVKWGVDNESKARKQFEDMCSPVETCGLYVSKSRPWFGASPDGVSVSRNFIVEIKCPYILRDAKPDDFSRLTQSQVRNHFCEKDGQKMQLKRTHKYYWQIQCQMWVTGIHLTKFVV